MQCPQHGALYNKGKSRASLALPHPVTYAMSSMNFPEGGSKAGGSVSMNSTGCDGNHLFQSSSSIVHSYPSQTKQKPINRQFEPFHDAHRYICTIFETGIGSFEFLTIIRNQKN